MYRLRINGLAVLFVVLFASCGFADLRPVEVSTSPGKSDMVLSGEYSPVSITFNTEMIRKEAENLLLVSSDMGMVDGDLSWNGNTLTFVPAAGWSAGTRYVLGLSGLARSVDGREIRLERNISFFAINRCAPPLVTWHSPADGESVSVNGLCIQMRFSGVMDRTAVESAFSADGMGDKCYEWADDDSLLTIIPDKTLSPWTMYRWTLKTTAKSADGVPLPKVFSAVFCTDLDRLLPEVSAVYPVLAAAGRWIPTGGSLEDGLGPGLGIAVEFNKPMADAAFRSLRFEPSLTGRTEKLSEKSMVFIPARDPEPEVAYTLIVSGDAKDTEGLKIGSDYRRVFIADIPYLRIMSINTSSIEVYSNSNSILPVLVSEADGGLVRFTVHFSLPFTEEAKQKTALMISLTPFFPMSLDPIALRFVSWISDDRLSMEWERLIAGTSDEKHYYRLNFPGGRGGINNGGGMYFQQDISLYMEAL